MRLIAAAPGTRFQLKHHYTAKPILNAEEAELYSVLNRICQGACPIICKTRIAEVLTHHDPPGFEKISQGYVSFLICRLPDWTAMLAVELDDLTPPTPERKERDLIINQVFAIAGIPLLRVPTNEINQAEQLTSQLHLGWQQRSQFLAGNPVSTGESTAA